MMKSIVKHSRNTVFFICLLLLFSLFNSCIGLKNLEISNTDFHSLEINQMIAVDSNIFLMIAPFKDSLGQITNLVIGQSLQKMEVGYPEGILGNFVADILLSTAKSLEGVNVDFAISNNGGLRNSIPAGDITIKNIFELMPFDNELVILELNSNLMDQLLRYIGQKQNEELAVSGLTLEIKNKNVEKVFVQNHPIDTNKTYFLAISDYLANGGGNMIFLKNVISRKETGIKVRDAIINYIKVKTDQNQFINAQTDGRIRILE